MSRWRPSRASTQDPEPHSRWKRLWSTSEKKYECLQLRRHFLTRREKRCSSNVDRLEIRKLYGLYPSKSGSGVSATHQGVSEQRRGRDTVSASNAPVEKVASFWHPDLGSAAVCISSDKTNRSYLDASHDSFYKAFRKKSLHLNWAYVLQFAQYNSGGCIVRCRRALAIRPD